MDRPTRGRGATANPAGRFERQTVEPFDDGWGSLYERAAAPAPRTTVAIDRARRVISENRSPDVPFELSINAYRGCEHGCIYCYARPSHAYLGLSPGLDFETRLFAKPDAAERFAAELSRPGYRCRVISLGANTDPYQPIERRLRITRGLLEVALDFGQPVSIVTKGTGVLRDLDLLSRMAGRRLVNVHVSLTTLDAELKRRLEPRAAAPQARLAVIRALREAGVPVGVLIAPVIPALTDHEIERLLAAAADAGALDAAWILLRLPGEVRELFAQWLAAHYPDRAERVLSLLRQARGGRDNDPRFFHRMSGSGPYADLLARRFALARRRLGLERGEAMRLDTGGFRVPPRKGRTGDLFADPPPAR